jgi:hypothetical protein
MYVPKFPESSIMSPGTKTRKEGGIRCTAPGKNKEKE